MLLKTYCRVAHIPASFFAMRVAFLCEQQSFRGLNCKSAFGKLTLVALPTVLSWKVIERDRKRTRQCVECTVQPRTDVSKLRRGGSRARGEDAGLRRVRGGRCLHTGPGAAPRPLMLGGGGGSVKIQSKIRSKKWIVLRVTIVKTQLKSRSFDELKRFSGFPRAPGSVFYSLLSAFYLPMYSFFRLRYHS